MCSTGSLSQLIDDIRLGDICGKDLTEITRMFLSQMMLLNCHKPIALLSDVAEELLVGVESE